MTYTTIQGDTWDMIAYKVYSNETLMPLLIAANTAHAATVIFSAGVVLAVPAAPAELPDDLPPWKR
ncbi:Phage Tail Protein X [compost metagenome]